MDLVKDKLEIINKEAEKISILQTAAQKTGRKPGEIALAIIAVVLLFIIIGLGSSILTTVVAILYPSYRSFRAIESKEEGDDKQWLTYWVVFSVFHFVDEFFGFLLQMIPFYFLLRVCFFIWMFLPTTQGAMVIYEKVLQPLIAKYGSQIDQAMNQASNLAGDIAKDAKKAAAEQVTTENILKAANAAQEVQKKLGEENQ